MLQDRQKRKSTVGIKFTKPGDRLLAKACKQLLILVPNKDRAHYRDYIRECRLPVIGHIYDLPPHVFVPKSRKHRCGPL